MHLTAQSLPITNSSRFFHLVGLESTSSSVIPQDEAITRDICARNICVAEYLSSALEFSEGSRFVSLSVIQTRSFLPPPQLAYLATLNEFCPYALSSCYVAPSSRPR